MSTFESGGGTNGVPVGCDEGSSAVPGMVIFPSPNVSRREAIAGGLIGCGMFDIVLTSSRIGIANIPLRYQSALTIVVARRIVRLSAQRLVGRPCDLLFRLRLANAVFCALHRCVVRYAVSLDS